LNRKEKPGQTLIQMPAAKNIILLFMQIKTLIIKYFINIFPVAFILLGKNGEEN